MNNGSMLVRSACPVRMFIGGMQMESRQKQQGREEEYKNPYAPGWYMSSQHSIFTLLLMIIGEKSLYSLSTIGLFHRVPAISHRAGRSRLFPVRE